MIEVNDKMSYEDVSSILARHGLECSFGLRTVATVLGGLEAEIAALQAQCESYAASLISVRGENAKLRAENRHLQYGNAKIINTPV